MANLSDKSKYVVDFIKTNFLNKKTPSQEELRCLELVTMALSESDSRILYYPKNEERVIFWYSKNIYILIEHRQITIAYDNNHRTCYIDNAKLFDDIIKMFDNRLDKEFSSVTEQIFNSKKKFFSDIMNYI